MSSEVWGALHLRSPGWDAGCRAFLPIWYGDDLANAVIPPTRKSFRPVAPTQARKPRNPFPSAVQGRDKDDLQREVDRILDKINEQGFGALTPEEKRTLTMPKTS